MVAFVAGTYGGTFSVKFADVPGLDSGSYDWRELYSGEEGHGDGLTFDVPLGDIAIFKVTPA